MSVYLLRADARALPLADGCVQCCVTSPPYWGLRDYGTAVWDGGSPECDHRGSVMQSASSTLQGNGHGGEKPLSPALQAQAQPFRSECGKCGARRIDRQLGLEATPDAYVAQMVNVFREVWRVLKDDGVLWLNLGDSYSMTTRGAGGAGKQHTNAGSIVAGRAWQLAPGCKPKDLVGIPWRVAFALQADGWYLRSDVIWCISGGAKVYARTQKGDMPMTVKDLVRLEPSTVKLWNGTKWTQALGWSKSPEPRDGALEIELKSGERIGCTRGHVWPTSRGNVRADELVVGDVIQTTSLPGPDAVTHAQALDDDVAWLCGLYLAEGSMSGDTVQLSGHADQCAERMARLERVAQKFHGTARAHVYENRASINLNGPVIQSVVRAYIHGDSAHNKGIKVRTWQRDRDFLRALLTGYLAGDGHYDAANDRWRLGFTRNDRLAGDLRTLAARLGLSMRLAACTVEGFGREWPAYRGDIRLERTTHHNARQDGEVVAIRQSRAREFWDIGVEDEPHLFALASGVLTHNSKPNPMPESVTDRPTKAHEYIFLLAKREKYYFDAAAVREAQAPGTVERFGNGKAQRRVGKAYDEGRQNRLSTELLAGRNIRSVWPIATQPYPGAHFATFPEAIPERCILAGSRVGDLVLDPFGGSGTVGRVAVRLARRAVMCELNPAYLQLAQGRTTGISYGLPLEVA